MNVLVWTLSFVFLIEDKQDVEFIEMKLCSLFELVCSCFTCLDMITKHTQTSE